MANGGNEDSGRLERILEAVIAMAQGDFAARAPVSERGDQIDALATGVSMLAEELSAKFAANEQLNSSLEQALRDMAAQHETIKMLSTPTLSVWEGILVVPLVGVLDEARASEMSSALLERVQAAAAMVVIVDVTGLATLDTATAKHLIDTFAAVSLLGGRCILTGISPANAQNMVGLGVEFTGVDTQRSLREGLRVGLGLTGREIVNRRSNKERASG